MADIQHRLAPLGQRHPVHDYEVANATARLALAVTDADVGRIAKQNDTSPPTFFMLARVTGGVAWVELGAAGMTAGQQQALNDATAAVAALRGPVYLVQTATAELANERTLEGADGCTVDYATAGKAIVRGPSIPAAATPAQVAALKAPTYLVQTASADLDNERTLEGSPNQIDVDFATAGKAIVKPNAALRLPSTAWTNVAFTTITGVTDYNRFEATALDPTLTAGDVGKFAVGSDGGLYFFAGYQVNMPAEAP